MNVNNVIAIDQVQYDLDDGEAFYNLSEPGVGSYFRAKPRVTS